MKFLARMKDKTRRVKLGDPMRRTTKMGPLVSEEHRQRVLEYIAMGRKEGRLVAVSRAITDFSYCTYLSDLAVEVEIAQRLEDRVAPGHQLGQFFLGRARLGGNLSCFGKNGIRDDQQRRDHDDNGQDDEHGRSCEHET